jgi:hypothetical protein
MRANAKAYEEIGVHETVSAGRVGVPTPVVIATAMDIPAGSVLIKSDTRLPNSAHFELKRYEKWNVLAGINGFVVGRMLAEHGCHFFFIVPEIRVGAVSVNHGTAFRAALQRLLSSVEAQNFNALEIVEITAIRFLGLHYVRVAAHPRHVRQSPFLRELDYRYVARNIWNFKGALRRRAQIDPTSKAI